MTQNIYEMAPEVYDEYISTEIEKRNFDKVFEIVQKVYAHKKTIEIMDFCCGTGIFPRRWLTKLNNIRYLGVDINPNFIDFAKNKLIDNRFSFVVDNSVTFKTDKKFDIIIATSSYHHIKDDQKRYFLENISSHLKKEGILIVYEKIIFPFSNPVEAIDRGTTFYLERIKFMLKTEKLSENQLFALFNELYLTSIRHEEYKVDLEHFKEDVESSGMEIKESFKL